MRNSKGFTLIELLVGAAILGFAFLLVAGVTTHLVKNLKSAQNRARFPSVVNAILDDIARKQVNYPWAGATIPANPFDNTSFAISTCYDENGGTAASEAACTYRVAYYSEMVTDGKFAATSDLAGLPLQNLMVRFQYKENGVEKNLVLSRLVTNVLRQ